MELSPLFFLLFNFFHLVLDSLISLFENFESAIFVHHVLSDFLLEFQEGDLLVSFVYFALKNETLGLLEFLTSLASHM